MSKVDRLHSVFCHTCRLGTLKAGCLNANWDSVNKVTDVDADGALQAYAQKIAGCLTAAASSSAPEEHIKQAQRWTCESNALRVFLAVGNLKNFIAFSTTRLDGSMGPGANQLTDAWYQDFLVSMQMPVQHLP